MVYINTTLQLQVWQAYGMPLAKSRPSLGHDVVRPLFLGLGHEMVNDSHELLKDVISVISS